MPSSSIIDHLPISKEEQKLRAQAVAQARASVRLEGTVLPVEIEELNAHYIAGQLSTSEHVQQVIQAADAMAKQCVSSKRLGAAT
jgi:hypothetical protein